MANTSTDRSLLETSDWVADDGQPRRHVPREKRPPMPGLDMEGLMFDVCQAVAKYRSAHPTSDLAYANAVVAHVYQTLMQQEGGREMQAVKIVLGDVGVMDANGRVQTHWVAALGAGDGYLYGLQHRETAESLETRTLSSFGAMQPVRPTRWVEGLGDQDFKHAALGDYKQQVIRDLLDQEVRRACAQRLEHETGVAFARHGRARL